MKKRVNSELLWAACLLVAVAIGWLLVRRGATPNTAAAVEQALREVQPADLESLTVYPLAPAEGSGSARPFQVRAPEQLRALLPALRQLRPLPAQGPAFQPLLEATLVVSLAAQPAAAWHLASRNIVFRLATSGEGEVAQLAQTSHFYRMAALSQRLRLLRDSVARP